MSHSETHSGPLSWLASLLEWLSDRFNWLDTALMYGGTEAEATFTVGVFATLVAVWAIISHRSIARRQATIELIFRLEGDSDVITARKKFIALAKDDGGLGKYAEDYPPTDKKAKIPKKKKKRTAREEALLAEWRANRDVIRRVLNELEVISIGIQRGALDYTVIKRWNKSTILNYHQEARGYIARVRSLKGETYYQELEALVRSFQGGQQIKRSRWWTLWI